MFTTVKYRTSIFAETLRVIYGDTRPTEASQKLQKWLLLLPDNIMAQKDAALRQERPFFRQTSHQK